jgi:hypothetical protein
VQGSGPRTRRRELLGIQGCRETFERLPLGGHLEDPSSHCRFLLVDLQAYTSTFDGHVAIPVATPSGVQPPQEGAFQKKNSK